MRFSTLFFIIYLLQNSNLFSIPAFPGAEGFGANTPGGRGGRVIHVTNLNPIGPGSFAAACEATGARIIIFNVSGIIEMAGYNIRVRSGNITIAGQTSPGGITINNGSLEFVGAQAYGPDPGGDDENKFISDIVVRHIRIRKAPSGEDCMGIYGGKRAVIDHVSVTWGCDESMSLTHAKDCTIQWCSVEESCQGGGCEANHNYGTLIGYNKPNAKFTLHHNLWAHHKRRSPTMDEKLGGTSTDIRNNVMYDWEEKATNFYSWQEKMYGNIVNNYYKSGPNTPFYQLEKWGGGGYSSTACFGATNAEVYISGNILEGLTKWNQIELAKNNCMNDPRNNCVVDELADLTQKCLDSGNCSVGGAVVNTDSAAVITVPAESAYELVMSKAGAFPRDAVTLRTVDEVKNGTGDWMEAAACANAVPGNDKLSMPVYNTPADTD
ncbi:MAG: hypothetical protein ABIA63_07210, partial [bacterium]